MQFTERVKEDLMSNLRLLFEQGRIVIPDDRDLMASLNCVEYERTRVGGYKAKSYCAKYMTQNVSKVREAECNNCT